MTLSKSVDRGSIPLTRAKHIVMNVYEVHITVKSNDLNQFRKDCEEIGVKPIAISLENRKGLSIMRDVMTSSRHLDNWKLPVIQITEALEQRGYRVIRRKVEENPYNPGADTPLYYESHIRVVCSPERVDDLRKIVREERPILHISRNIFKALDNGLIQILLTYRHKETLEHFKLAMDVNRDFLTKHGFVFDKVEVEAAIYDSNEKHDEKWIYS